MSEFKILQPLNIEWKPKEDITAYELAQAMQVLLQIGAIMPLTISGLDDSVLRHFEIYDPNEDE